MRAGIAWVLDCEDPDALAPFWAAALGYVTLRRNPPYVALGHPADPAPELLLQRVPEPKQGKNRMHLDLRVPDVQRELARLLGLGARRLRGPFDDQGCLTVVLADPQGNEFCLIRADA